MPDPVYFLIYSRGRTATQWLAKSLSSIDGVMCSHGYDPSPYAHEIRGFRYGEPDGKLRDTYEMMARGEPHVDEYFDMLERDAPKPFRAFGNIHGYDAILIAGQQTTRTYQFAQITRHPFARALSFAAKWRNDYIDHAFVQQYMDKGAISDPRWRGQSLAFRLFAAATDVVFSEDMRRIDSDVPLYRIEDLTTDPAAFALLVRQITGDAIEPTDAEIIRIMASKPVDASAQNADLAERFHQLWLQTPEFAQYFSNALRNYACLHETYERLGYDLSFVRPWPSAEPVVDTARGRRDREPEKEARLFQIASDD